MEDKIFYFGVVEDNNDPDMKGRVRCRIFGVHNPDKKILPTKDLQWCVISNSVNSSSVSGVGSSPLGIEKGTWCVIIFADPYSKQIPVVLGTLSGSPSDVVEEDEYLDSNRKYGSDNDKGFVDPDKDFPKLKNESDINRLCRNEHIDETIVQTKKDNRIKDIKMANSDDEENDKENTWSEPESQYDAKYPYNKVTQTVSGHIVEYDDTPGKERIQQYHKAGTFYEIYPDGSQVEKIVKDNYQLILGDDYIYVEGGVKVFIQGDANVNIGGGAELQVGGDCNAQIKGNLDTYVNGEYNLGVQGDINISTNGKINTISSGVKIESSDTVDIIGSYINLNK